MALEPTPLINPTTSSPTANDLLLVFAGAVPPWEQNLSKIIFAFVQEMEKRLRIQGRDQRLGGGSGRWSSRQNRINLLTTNKYEYLGSKHQMFA
jgi:hypothetical protein